MAKIIKLTPEYLDELRADFEAALSNAKLSDGKISFSKTFSTVDRKATVLFSETAWFKMQLLIQSYDSEIGWHGLAFRGDDPEKDEYIIKDILVYPQSVTGVTVTTDQDKYQEWLFSHDDDVFNNIRMQGHSHVNMSTNPSGVDTSLYDRILGQLDDDMFYIFLIYNKKGDKTYKIYDLKKNVLFETSDVTVKVVEDGLGMRAFLSDAKGKVTTRSFQNGYTGGSVYSGYPVYGKTQQSAATAPAAPPKPAAVATTPSPAQKSGDSTKKNSVSGISGKSSSAKRKGKRKQHGSHASIYGQTSMRDEDDYAGYDDDGYFSDTPPYPYGSGYYDRFYT